MANKKISELQSRTPVLADLMLVGDPSSGYSYKCTITSLSTVIESAIGGNYVTLATTQTISGAKTFSNNLTLTSVTNAPTTQTKFLTLNASNIVNYRTGAEVLSDIGGQGTISLTTTGTSGAATFSSNTLNIPQYQGVISLTTTGTSGAATLVGNTLNIPQYSPDLSGYVPNTRTLTINGTTYDLSANRTWSVGTVTSVGLSVPTGFSITGSPIISSGTLALAFTSGYSLPTTASQTNWDTAYNRSLTSIGVSGTTTKTLTLTKQDGSTLTASWTDINTDAVTSVFGRTGAIIATEGDYTLTQLGDVTITTPSTGQVLKYNGTTWINDTDSNTGTVTSVGLSTGTTGTDISVSGSPITSSGTITLNIPTASATNRGALSSTDWTTFNNKLSAAVTSLNGLTASTQTFATGTSGTDFAISSSTSTHTFNLPTASATNRGALSSTDWTTFNNKQNAISLTTTGTSGAATLVGSTLNIPVYAPDLSGYVPTSRTLTINGTAFDLSANRSWSVGTVTSVAATAGTGISITGSPITSSGTLTITNTAPDQTVVLTAGSNITITGTYPSFTIAASSGGGTVTSVAALTLGTTGTDLSSTVANSTTTPVITLNVPTASATNRGALSSTDWSTFNNKQSAISLTTTGNSGAATFVSNTLNIPNYTLAGLGGISGSGTTNYIPKFTSSSAIGNSAITDDGTDVTITSRVLKTGAIVSSAVGGAGNQEGLRIYNDNAYLSFFNTANTTRSAYIQGNTTDLTLSTSLSTPILFATNNSERMRLDASGNLGLGTTSPNSNGGASAKVLHINSSGVGDYAVTHYTNGSTGSNAADGLLVGNIGADAYIFNYENSPISFGTNSAERMRITSAGNIGIGTTAPEALLHVFGSTSSLLIVGGTGATAKQTIIGHVSTGNGYTSIQSVFQGTSFTPIALNPSGGNVGIGTTAPFSRLEVNSGTGTAPTLKVYSTPSSYTANLAVGIIDLGTNASGNDVPAFRITGISETAASSANGYATFSTRASGTVTERMRITSGGLVGIGTTSPTDILNLSYSNNNGGNVGLYVKNTNTGTAANYAGLYAEAQNGTVGFRAHATTTTALGGYGVTGTSTAHPLLFVTSDAERMRITSAGELLIATTTDAGDYKLQVSGNAYVSTSIESGNTIYAKGNITEGSGYQLNAITMGYSSTNSYGWLTAGGAAARTTLILNGGGGDVLINTSTDAGAYPLQVNGSVYATAYFESSDLRLKNVLINTNSETFAAIQYKWNDNRDNKIHWGYSAQDVMKYIPDAIQQNNDGYYTLDYHQAHTYKIYTLENRIAELEKQIQELK